MNEKYNITISKLAGLFTQLASEIKNDESLEKGQKFLLLQRLFADIAPSMKTYESLEKELKEYAKENITDGETVTRFGAEITVKYNATPAPTLDPKKLYDDLVSAYAELNVNVDDTKYYIYREPAKRVIIQSILNK